MQDAAVVRRRHRAEAPGIRQALRHRDLRLLLAAFVVDACGTWAAAVVLAAWVFERTGSPVWLAALAACRWIPGALAAPPAGIVADRFDRRTLLVACAAASGVAACAITAAVVLSAPVPVVLALVVVLTVVAAPVKPAAGALTPQIVDEAALPAAAGLLATAENLVVIAGPALGAALLLLGAPVAGLALNAASCFAAACVAAGLRPRGGGSGRQGRGAAPVLEALAALRRAPTANVLIALCAVDTLLAWSYGVVYLPLARHLGLGGEGYGLLLAAAAAGGVAGALVASRLDALRRPAAVMLGAVLLQSLPYAITAFTREPVIGVGLQVVSGAGMVIAEVTALLAVQREVPEGRLGGAIALLETTTLLASAAGSTAAAALLSALPVEQALLALGVGDALLAVLLLPLLVRVARTDGSGAPEPRSPRPAPLVRTVAHGSLAVPQRTAAAHRTAA